MRASTAYGVVGVLGVLSLASCSLPSSGAGGSQGGPVTLRYQGWANTVTLPELAADLGYFPTVRLDWVGNTTSGPQDIQSAATAQTDFGGAFSGAVVKLIAAGAPVKAVVNYYGEDARTFNGFYVLQGSPIRTARDLVGKKVAVNTLGAHAEAVIDTYLRKSGLTPAEVAQVQLVPLPPNDTEQALRREQIDVATLGGVLQDHAVAAGGVRSLFSDYGMFGAFNGGQYVLRSDFIAQHPDAAKEFVTGVAKAIEWERTTARNQVIARFTKIIEARHRNERTDNLKYWKSVGVASKGGAVSDADFTRWEDWLVGSGILTEGALKPADLYTNRLNALVGAS
ncbi:MAG TPA: ABC transporter substrate-binding protein [Intrasporangium sp.]|uniref:ABC transporter substrate-binding protein n=1 Tax=Intrasporangium sp. TaxID=1925024 RepID=UPI002D76D49A|nr:ABC transporter substrate-binding protein [Intrasporangium sp.]HET7398555.1 ABC transporter substrate-binding protein [Intrasporangium sp.]